MLGGPKDIMSPLSKRCRGHVTRPPHKLGPWLERASFGGAKVFARHFPKSFCVTFAYKLSSTKIMKTFFWYDLQKRHSCVFLQTLGAIFEIKQRWTTFLSRFSFGDFVHIFRDISQIFRDFARIIGKLNVLGVRLHTRFLHHCQWSTYPANIQMSDSLLRKVFFR